MPTFDEMKMRELSELLTKAKETTPGDSAQTMSNAQEGNKTPSTLTTAAGSVTKNDTVQEAIVADQRNQEEQKRANDVFRDPWQAQASAAAFPNAPPEHISAPVNMQGAMSPAQMVNIIMMQQQQIRDQGLRLDRLTGTPEQTNEPSEQTYYHRIPGSSIVVCHLGPGGESIPETLYFDYKGELVTSDPDVHAFLKPIVSPHGYISRKEPAIKGDPNLAAAARGVREDAAHAIDKLGSTAGSWTSA